MFSTTFISPKMRYYITCFNYHYNHAIVIHPPKHNLFQDNFALQYPLEQKLCSKRIKYACGKCAFQIENKKRETVLEQKRTALQNVSVENILVSDCPYSCRMLALAAH